VGTAEGGIDPNLSVWADREWVPGMLQSLSEGQRQVMAFVVDGFTLVEISALVSRSPDAIRQTLYAARLSLKSALRRGQVNEQTPKPGKAPGWKETRWHTSTLRRTGGARAHR
jgi:DNA-directed RNA polymerase specialized sigma24 family protein